MKKLVSLALVSLSLRLLAVEAPAHLSGELNAEEILDGAYPWPASPKANVSYDDTGFARERLTKVPPPGAHPRILISPEELPDLRRRVADTEMGRALLKNLRGRVHDAIKTPGEWGTKFYDALAAGDLIAAKKLLAEKNGKPPGIGHYQPFIEAFALEALDALISKDETRGKKVGAALANYAAIAEPAIDGALAQPLGDDVWRVKLNGPTTGDWSSDQGLRDIVGYEILGYTYDFAYNFMTEAQRTPVRRVIAKMTHGELWMGARLPHHFRNWNWCAVGLSQPLLALAIEGEDGYDPRIFKMGVEIARDYFSYGISENGFSTEAVGYTQFGLVWANPFVVAAARRGENLLAQNHLRAMIDWYLHAMEPVALSLGQSSTNADWEQIQRSLPQAWTSHGDGGDEGPAIWTMAMWKYFYPHDPKIDLLWRVVVNKNRGRPFTGNFHLIEPLLWANDAPISFKPDLAEKLKLPLALFDPKRSSLIAHSGWNTNSAVLQFECRTDSVGASHEHADRGAFTFSALGRQWAKDNFRSVETRHHNSVLIEGLGQGFWPGPGKWLGLDDEGWALVAACDVKDCYDWWWPKEIKTEDTNTFERFKYSRWQSNLTDAEQFQKDFAGHPPEKDSRPSVVEHWRGFLAHDPRMWDEDSWPVRLTNNPVMRAFRTVAFVREPQPYLLVVDDLQKDSQERLYEWLMQMGMNTAVARMAGNDVILCDATVPLDENGVPCPRRGDRELLVRVLDCGVPAKAHDFQAKPSFRLETFERKDTLVPEASGTALSGARSFGLDKRLVIASRTVAPNFKILLWPLREGQSPPETVWNDSQTELKVKYGRVTDKILFGSAADGRTRLELERAGKTPALLAAPAAPLPFGTLLHQPAPTEVIYKHTASGDLKLFCFQPPGIKTGETRPAALWIHGGGWTGGTCESFFPLARYTATRGAASFVVEYRLAKTNGAVTVADCLADCKSAVRYLRGHAAEFGVDPNRLAVLGESAGGHLAAGVGTLDGFNDPADDLKISARPDALVLYDPPTKFEESNFQKLFANGASPAEKTNFLRKLSPLFHVGAGQPPAICIHGLADTVVSPDNSRQFAAAMQRVGNRCDLALLPELPHAFLIPNYKCSEAVVVSSLLIADKFMVSLGYFSGEPNLIVSDPPSWTPKWPPVKKSK